MASEHLFEMLLLFGRWLHITVAVTWIGTSIFFMWLDRTLTPNPDSKREGHVGELWMVHGGGFYHVEKLLMGPTKVPEHLHWFKWESYWTWMSGAFLLLLLFYTGSGTFLMDSSVASLGFLSTAAIGIFSVIGSWFFYDYLWESTITKAQPIIGHALTVLWLTGMSYFLCHVMSGRAAYMHIGAMIGTWMTANVFIRIIPRQLKMVEAARKGEKVNQEWAKNAKNRSTHNTYLTLPVIFIMLSNHFPSTYGSSYNWLILLVLTLAGAFVREFFVVRLSQPSRARMALSVGLTLIFAMIFFTRPTTVAPPPPSTEHAALGSQPGPALTGRAKIHGRVLFQGVVPPPEKIDLPLSCRGSQKGDVFKEDLIVNNGGVKNALVHVLDGVSHLLPPPKEPVKINQKNCMYDPRVVVVRLGQPVEFMNSDTVFHNIRSVSSQAQDFNDAMPNQNDRITKVFTRPEVFLQSKCSVHPWMTASIAVVDNSFYGLTGDDGSYSIDNLPPGKYIIEIAHEILGKQTREVTIAGDESIDLDITLQKGGP